MPSHEHSHSSTGPALSRRSALGLGTVTAGAVLAGCSSGGTSTEVDPSAAGLPGIALVEIAEVPIGSAVRVDHPDGQPIIVTQPTAGEVAAFSAACTHQQCAVVPAGDKLTCPCHGSAFDVATGAVITGPAVQPLARIQVHIADGRVVTGAR